MKAKLQVAHLRIAIAESKARARETINKMPSLWKQK